MSRWLKSVNTLFDQLDGQVEAAVDDDHGVPTSRGAVDHVLRNRGLHQGEDYEEEELYSEEEEDYDEHEDWEDEDGEYYDEAEDEEEIDLESPSAEGPLFEDEWPSTSVPESVHQSTQQEVVASDDEIDESVTSSPIPVDSTGIPEDLDQASAHESDPEASPASRSHESSESPELVSAAEKSDAVDSASPGSLERPLTPPPASEQFSVPSTTSMIPKMPPPSSGQLSVSSSNNRKELLRRSNQEKKRAQNEARQLRKHVIALHQQLETVEAEMKAQREELQRAAERLERDRSRHNEEREEMMDEHDEELEAQKEDYERMLEEQKERHEEQMDKLRERLSHEEEMRMQEGGDWTMELEDAVSRERESLKKLSTVQEENAELQSRVSKLEAQQTALQNRLESSAQNLQNVTNREREAEDRLDAALSLHSRQLSQRQAREAELERTVADLGAALVVARQKRPAPTYRQNEGNESMLKEQLAVAEEDLETVKAQLTMERQRCEMQKQELQDMSQERTDEASAAQARQRQHDREAADLANTISRLQTSLRDYQRAGGLEATESGTLDTTRVARLAKEAEESKETVKTLSEQLIRQQDLVESSKTEILALKGRLQAERTRADNAENALAQSASAPNVYEMDIGGMSAGSSKLRRRVKGGRSKFGKSSGSSVKSIRSALNMEPGRVSEGAEQVAVTIDAIDSFMVETGSLFRHEPLARAAFFLYLVILHIWTFCLVIFHAHSFEAEHGDFGSLNENGGVGPDAVVQHSYRQLEQMGKHP